MTNAYSDLIHLFIDGEATETERNTLFGALKDSPELQEEFASAMELKKAFAADIMQLQPPSYLQSQIAERAGLIVAASASVATAPVVVNSISSGISSVLTTAAPIATIAVSKGLIALAIGTSVGILSTIGVIKLTSNDAAKNTTPSAAQAITRQMAPTHTPGNLLEAASPAQLEIAKGTFKNNVSTISDQSFAVNKIPGNANAIRSERKYQNIREDISTSSHSSNTPSIIQEKTLKIEDKSVNTSTVIENTNKPSDLLSAITPVNINTPLLKSIGGNNVPRELFNPEGVEDIGTSGIGKFSARLTGIAASKLYQGEIHTTLPIWNNIAGAVKYDAGSAFALGAEIGQETFPIYLANGSGGYRNYQSITWYGISGTVTGIYVDLPLNAHPEVRMLGALSNAGPIAKISAGLIVPVTPRLSFSIDGEETLLFIQSNGANITGNKLALTGSLTFHF